MDRVAVVGCCGSGKSYVARQIGRLTGAPVTHLDEMYYDDEWNTAEMDDFAAVQRELVARPRWVIDGHAAEPQIQYSQLGALKEG